MANSVCLNYYDDDDDDDDDDVQCYLSQSWDFGTSGFCCKSRYQLDVKGFTAISFPGYLTR